MPSIDAVQEQAILTLSPRQPTATFSWTVPEDKQLMIQWISVTVHMPVNQIPDVRLATSSRPLGPGTNSMLHNIGIPGPVKASGTIRARHERSQPVKLYARPGTRVTLFVGRNINSGTATSVVSWPAQLIDSL